MKGTPTLEVDWHLTNRCNYFCEYCHPQIRRVLNLRDLNERPPAEYAQAFGRLAECCHILMSGGEPFMFPDFIDLCRLLTRKHFISINTNLAHDDVRLFFDTIVPDRVVGILAAIHVEERERLGLDLRDFADKYIHGRANHFTVTAAYVLFPPLLSRAETDIRQLRDMGVDRISGKVFKGVYENRRYPESYTDSERAIVRLLAGEYTMTESYLSGEMSFIGQHCSAGVEGIKVNVTGEIQRCASVREPLGNLFDSDFQLHHAPYPCPARRVLVVSQCKEYLEKARHHNETDN